MPDQSEKIAALETQINKIIVISEMMLNSLDITAQRTQDLATLMQMSTEDLRRVRERILEDGFISRIDAVANQLIDIKIKQDGIREQLEQVERKYNNVFLKLLIAIIGIGTTTLGGILTLLLNFFFKKP